MFKKILVMSLLGVVLNCNANADGIYKIRAGKPHKPTDPKYVEVYAHRGARAFAPENVLPAYKAGLKVGTDWVDMDIGITKDGVVVITHDIWLNPDIISNNGKFWANSKDAFYKKLSVGNLDNNVKLYLVNQLTLSQLQKYEAGIINPNSSYAKYFPEQVAVPGTHIPTLQSVIEYVNLTTNNKVNFQIEIKNDPDHPSWTLSPKEFAQKVYDILAKNDLFDRSEIQSFDWQPLYELQNIAKQHGKHVHTAYLVGYDDKIRMLDPNPKIAGSWSGGKLLKDYNRSLPQMVKALGGSCYEPEDVSLTKDELDEAHKLGLKVAVWTWPEHSGKIFDPKVVERLIDWGVDGIITDDPGQLVSMLAARGYATPDRYNAK